ncbi:copper-translocating P-type ATPase [Sinosporangium siamense]|uniref:Copper-translocating P-type ATPase n=1 Tax=Sinosporangium siamense TaxID=1367973 RepID=A0A919V5C9_9ACTN|nr:copper-translocating P-type ATPase [Sinosporangium siamense]
MSTGREGRHAKHAAHDAAAHGTHEQGGHGGHGGHGAHGGHGDHAAQFRDRLWISLILTVPIIIYSHMIQEWFGFTPPHFPGSAWLAPVLGTIVFFYGGQPFLTGGFQEAKDRRPGMMLLISLAIAVAFAASLATAFGYFQLDFWWELALLIDIMLLGHWLEMRALGQASSALDALAALLPDEADRVTPDGTESVPVSDLREGDVVLVRSGGRVPADGLIIDGEAAFDESMLTGESRPVTKGVGDRAVAGTVATDSAVRVRIEAVGEGTTLAGIRRLVEQAQASRSRAQALADRAAALLFYVAAGAGVLTFVVWALLGELGEAVERTVTVLVIACPHALGLAIPLVIAISTAMSARSGILVKDRLALERMRTVDAVLFDKTGTLTKGEPEVTGVHAVDGDETSLLKLAGAVEADSEHPLARAIVAAAKETGALPIASGFRSMTGRGVQAEVDGRTVAIGGPALLRELGLAELPAQEWRARGAAVLHVVADGRVVGALALEDAIRPESREAIRELHALGKRVVMITGDARQVAEAVAAELGVDETFAEVLPEDKDAKVAELKQRGLTVAMVGDGVNDAPALARADVGIAIGAGTDVAIESAGVVLASDDPRGVLGILRLSKASYRKMLQNLAWATGYNLAAIPLAAGVLAGWGITLAPAVGAVLMSLSTIVVALNAQLLRGVRLHG